MWAVLSVPGQGRPWRRRPARLGGHVIALDARKCLGCTRRQRLPRCGVRLLPGILWWQWRGGALTADRVAIALARTAHAVQLPPLRAHSAPGCPDSTITQRH